MFVVVVVVVGGGDVGRTAANAATPQPTPQRRSHAATFDVVLSVQTISTPYC